MSSESVANDQTATKAVLEVRGLRKSYGPTRALRSASLALTPGEVHVLLGENGSGKSTLVKILSGVQTPDGGELLRDGQPAPFPRVPRGARNSGVATVFQEVLVVGARSVVENAWLGSDTALKRRTPKREKRSAARQAIVDLLGYELDLDIPIEMLTLSERQACCVVRAILQKPQILILDESTSALDVAVRDRLFAMVRKMTVDGLAVLFITHRMDELEALADRVTVMRSGETVATVSRGDWTVQRLIHLMTGAESLAGDADGATVEPVPLAAVAEHSGEVVLEATGVELRPGAKTFDFRVRRGELVGVAGLEGQGQTEFLDVLRGARRAGGEVAVLSDAHRQVVTSVASAAKYGIAYVPRERREAVFSWMSIRENFAMPTLAKDQRFGVVLSRRKSLARLSEWVHALSIVLGSEEDAITTLSGGNQQKVVVARWLARNPQILVLNDPTRGVDIGAKRDLYQLLHSLAAQGVAVVMLSTEVDEHVELMDRVHVFREHEMEVELKRGELSRAALVGAFFGYEGSKDVPVGDPS